MSTVRSFITPNLPQAVKLYLEQVSHDLSERILGVRWVRPDGVYQTLNFLGGRGSGADPGYRSVHRSGSQGEDGSDLSVTTIGVFPKPA